ncbi:MAG: hypothetical protein ACLFWB_11205 [Armatimonadota bacterium]
MQIIMYVIAGLMGLFGALWLIAAGKWHSTVHVIIGVVLLGVAAALVYIARMQTPDTKIIQEIELSGDVNPEQMRCNACGGQLSSENLEVRGGAIFVECPYCGTEYQLEEKPKW